MEVCQIPSIFFPKKYIELQKEHPNLKKNNFYNKYILPSSNGDTAEAMPLDKS